MSKSPHETMADADMAYYDKHGELPKQWHSDVAPVKKGTQMPMTEEYFDSIIKMRDELIDEQRVEISKLKMQVNKLQQRLATIVGSVHE